MKARDWFYSQSFHGSAMFDPPQPPPSSFCEKCNGEVLDDGEGPVCVDCAQNTCRCGAPPDKDCICEGPPEPDYDAASFAWTYEAAWQQKRGLR